MKPLIICDVDCTLYSYAEFIQTNFLHPKESMMALFSIPINKNSFPAVERTWKTFEVHIENRIKGLIEIASAHGDIMFLSAFPDEEYKKQTFFKNTRDLISSFPNKKIDLLSKKSDLGKILLTIGDRVNDKGIARAYGSKLVYLPFYHPIHKLTAEIYTASLLAKVTQRLHS